MNPQVFNDPQVFDNPKVYSDTVIFDVQTFAMLTFFRSDVEKTHAWKSW